MSKNISPQPKCQTEREQRHWEIATRMFFNAMRQPVYLKAATMSFQMALALDRLLARVIL